MRFELLKTVLVAVREHRALTLLSESNVDELDLNLAHTTNAMKTMLNGDEVDGVDDNDVVDDEDDDVEE